jgi:hypothetical protein
VRSRRLSLCLVGLALACEEQAPPLPTQPAVSAPALAAASPVTSRSVAGEYGFDLAPLPDGALLVTADRDGGVSAHLLDRDGGARGAAINVAAAAAGKAFEIAVASNETRLGVAWVASGRDGKTTSFGVLGDASTRSFSAPLTLGEAPARGAADSGYLALDAGEGGTFVALRRGLDEPCDADPKRSCATFGFREISPSGVEKRGLSMSVPAPCSRPLAGFVTSGERWHYGLCSQDGGAPLTTHFMRQLQPFYVDVHTSLQGCTPLGATKLPDDVVLVGDCAKGRRGVRVGGMGQPLRELDLSKASVECQLGRPLLRAPGERPLELALREPRGGLDLLLPIGLSPGHSRVVWTGNSLLSATWLAGEVVIRRFQCRGSRLSPA